jgi:hypothetical protein
MKISRLLATSVACASAASTSPSASLPALAQEAAAIDGASVSTVSASPALSEQSIVSLAARLKREREAQLDRAGVFPLHPSSPRHFSLKSEEKQSFLPGVVSSNVAREREEAERPASVLPSSWHWSGGRERAFDAAPLGQRVAESWRLGLDVPVAHPWGVAKLAVGYERSGGGLARDAEAASADDRSAGSLALQQELKIGSVSGSARLSLAQEKANPLATAQESERQNGAAEGSARLRWQMNKAVALTGSHQSRVEVDKSLSIDGEEVDEDASASRRTSSELGLEWKLNPALKLSASTGKLVDTSMEKDVDEQSANQRVSSQVGVEWKLGRSLSLGASAGKVSAGNRELGDEGEVPLSLQDESRAHLELNKRTSKGSLGVRLSRSWAEEEVRRDVDKRNDALSLQAERKLAPWLSVSGTWRLAGETNYLASRLQDNAQREAEARVRSALGSFALRYSDWSNRQASSDGSVLGGSGAREYGVRYNIGDDAGLGLSVEYSVRDERAGQNRSNWRLGLTYR